MSKYDAENAFLSVNGKPVEPIEAEPLLPIFAPGDKGSVKLADGRTIRFVVYEVIES